MILVERTMCGQSENERSDECIAPHRSPYSQRRRQETIRSHHGVSVDADGGSVSSLSPTLKSPFAPQVPDTNGEYRQNGEGAIIWTKEFDERRVL